MKIIFVNIYPLDTIARYLLSSYILRAFLENHIQNSQVDIEVINFHNMVSPEKIMREVNKKDSDIVCYSCYVWNIELVKEVVKDLNGKQIQIMGGPEITLNTISRFRDSADFYIIGEGELPLLGLISLLSRGGCIKKDDLPNGIAVHREGVLHYKENKERVKLEDIPPVFSGKYIERKLLDGGQVFFETQRGCKFRCKYCTYHKDMSRISYYSIEKVIDEIVYLIEEHHITAIRFIDAIFTTDMQRAKAIVKCFIDLKKVGNSIPWIYWEFTYDSVDEEFCYMLSQLKEKENIDNISEMVTKNSPQLYSDILKGYKAINCVGIQSISNKVLSIINRPQINFSKLNSFNEWTRKYNLAVKYDVILGLPGETVESYFSGLERIMDYIERTDNLLNIHLLQILPGSDLENICDEYSIRYSQQAPHNVIETNSMKAFEIKYAASRSAILFRVINSPLRPSFFEYKKSYELTVRNISDAIYDAIAMSLPKIILLLEDRVLDDNYWNYDIFHDISSEWLHKWLAK